LPGCKLAGARRRKVDYRDLLHVFSRRERAAQWPWAPSSTTKVCPPMKAESGAMQGDDPLLPAARKVRAVHRSKSGDFNRKDRARCRL
jgi:hypothetical protein